MIGFVGLASELLVAPRALDVLVGVFHKKAAPTEQERVELLFERFVTDNLIIIPEG
ncbi:MAG TPA: hypothetical protein VFP97_11535 [Chitinophagaceae bacterium]|nr:hypothetical protein [Chitinophagaceae bacterium]